MSNSVAKSVTTHRAEIDLGPPIKDGAVRWVSSSLVLAADHDSYGGCLRSVYFERVLGRAREESKALGLGNAVHKEIENYLRTGQDALGPIARAGKWAIPEPGPGLDIEKPIIEVAEDGTITKVYLCADGVPVAGHVDLFNHRGEYIDPEGEIRREQHPHLTLEVKDWKTTAGWAYAKSAQQIADGLQATIYAAAAFQIWPQYEYVRSTHGYFLTKGAPEARLVTSIRAKDQVLERFEHVEKTVRKLKLAVIQPKSDSVEPNTRSCRSYNKQCLHLDFCPEGLGTLRASVSVGVFGPPGFDFDSILGDSKMLGSVDNLLDALVAEETALRENLDQQKPDPVPASPDFVEAVAVIQGSPLGMPALCGRAALMFATMTGVELSAGLTLEGTGKLAKLQPLADPGEVIKLGKEIKVKYPIIKPEPRPEVTPVSVVPLTLERVEHLEQPIAILPPDAPESNPVLAADPDPVLAADPDPIVETVTQVEATALIEAMAVESAVTLPAKKRGRPPKRDTGTLTEITTNSPVCNTTLTYDPGEITEAVTEQTVIIALDIDGFIGGKDFAIYCNTLVDELCKQYGVTDLRCAPENSPLGYNKWRGVLAAAAKATPPDPGLYLGDTRSNELMELIAVSLAQYCVNSGGHFLRGRRS